MSGDNRNVRSNANVTVSFGQGQSTASSVNLFYNFGLDRSVKGLTQEYHRLMSEIDDFMPQAENGNRTFVFSHEIKPILSRMGVDDLATTVTIRVRTAQFQMEKYEATGSVVALQSAVAALRTAEECVIKAGQIHASVTGAKQDTFGVLD